MTKAAQMAKITARGGVHMLWGLVLSTVISSVGTVIIARVLGADNYGLYYIAFTVPNLLSVLRDFGINTAMIRYSAQYNSENDVAKIKRVFVAGLIFEVAMGLLLSLVAFAFSGVLAVGFHRPSMVPLIQVSSLIILTGALTNAASAAFTGMEIMHLNSIVLVVQSLVKTGLIVGLVLLGFGTLGAVTGFTLGTMVAGVTGALLMWVMYRSLPKPVGGKLEVLATTKIMIKYGLPASAGTILSAFLGQLYNYILAVFVINNAVIGNYNLALLFVVLITFFATPVTTMMFPAFSKLDYTKDKETLKSVFQYSVKYAAIIVVPVTTLVMALSQPAISTLFQDRYAQAPFFLVLLSVSYLYAAFGSLSTGNLIIGQGYAGYSMKLSVLTAVIGLPLSFLLIFKFGVTGLIVTNLVSGLPSIFLGLRFIKKQFGVTVDWASSAKILFSSALAAVLTFILLSLLPFSSPVKLLIGVVFFVVVIVPTIIFSRTLKKPDIIILREIIGGLGSLRRIILPILNLLEKLVNLIQGQ